MKNLLNSIKIITLALIIGLGVSYVSAFTPGAQVPAVINTSINDQTKEGGIFSEKWLASDLSFFTKTLFPGTDSWLNIGGGDSTITPDMINNNGSTIPLTIDLKDRTKTTKTVEGQNAINFISGQATCATATALINDRAPAFEFTSGANHADLIARQLQLKGGTPQDNSVLAAVDSQGNAVWAKLVVENGVLKVIDNKTNLPIPSTGVASPVATDASCAPAPNVTYAWSSGNWGACTSTAGSNWRDFIPSPSINTFGSIGQTCRSWIDANDDYYTTSGSQTRTVVCKNSNGDIVADSQCTGVKPDSTQSCSINLDYRTSLRNTDPATQVVTTDYSSSGVCLYAKVSSNNPTNFDFGFADECKSASITGPVPAGGYRPVSFCGQLTVSGTFTPGYGFNAGPGPGGNGSLTFGSYTRQLQVKPQ